MEASRLTLVQGMKWVVMNIEVVFLMLLIQEKAGLIDTRWSF